MKKSIRVFVILCIIAMLPGWFQGFNHGIGNKQWLGMISLASAPNGTDAYETDNIRAAAQSIVAEENIFLLL